MAQDPAADDDISPKAFPLITVGASAGGLKAFEGFIAELQSDFPFAVVFIQHLSSSRKSLMPELLRSRRPDLVVEEISDGLEVLPGRIYLHPAAGIFRLMGRFFHIEPGPDERNHFPIDGFLTSLAEDSSGGVIAVILSGAGTDGARGVQAIKAEGGTVFAQDPVTAEFTGMPLAAINTGLVDAVLSPAEIARQILKICGPGMQGLPEGAPLDCVSFEPVFRIIFDKTGHRFNHYKKNVVARRIRRRMNLHGIASIGAYMEKLATETVEADQLASDLMIGVTSFFRDRLSWKALQAEVIKPLIQARDDSPVRIWTPACATGEEVYSVIMMLQDELDTAGRKREITAFASDINDRALERARAAIYPESVTADIPQEYVDKYLTRSADGLTVTVSPDIRQHVVFARHDILTDPPFSRMDLIVCRNLLIYLAPPAQDKCIALFHYALSDGGCLFLGSAESAGDNTAHFISVGHKKNRIYRKVGGVAAYKRPLPAPFSAGTADSFAFRRQPAPEQVPTITDMAQKALIEECGLAAVAISQNYDIMYYSGPMNRYLRNPEGGPTQNLLDLLPEKLRTRIRGAFYRVMNGEKPVSIRAVLADDRGRKRECALRLSKLKDNIFLVTFREKSIPPKTEESPLEGSGLDETAMRQLESELCATREDLQGHIEQLESLSEELQSSNEELQASNEELETSQEELQSLNEELLTVNAQLQAKIEELDETNNDLTNFIASTDIPTLFLDRRLRVRRFTPAMERIVHLIPADIGRPVGDISQSSLGPDLVADATAVLETLDPVRREIGADNSWYERATLPYKTGDNKIEGVVIAYSDVTERKLSAEALRESEELYRSLFENMLNGFAYCRMLFDGGQPADFVYLAVNDAFVKLTGLQDVVGKKVTEVIPGIRESNPQLFEIYGGVSLSGNPARFETYVEALKMWFSISVYSPKKEHFVAIFDVINERKRAEEQLRESREKISLILNSTAEGIYGLDLEGRCTFCNPSAVSMLGYRDEGELIGRNMHELIHHTKADGTRFPREECASQKALITGEHIHRDREVLWRADGNSFPAEYWTHPIFKGGLLIGTVVTFVDISERAALENQLLQAQKMEVVGQLAGGIAHDFNNNLSAIIGYAYLLQTKMKADDPMRADIDQILESTQRAAEVTHNLLAFSRRQVMSRKPVDLNELVARSEKLLSRLIGEHIEFIVTLSPEPVTCLADPVQIEQVLMNLVTNARDAMPKGGRLEMRICLRSLKKGVPAGPDEVKAGTYAVVSVSDTGAGMAPEVLSRIFEPFFTTKEPGHGTGLGLSMAYGIVKQHDGYVSVESTPNAGTTFELYIPATKRQAAESQVKQEMPPATGGTETILIAEDDDKLRLLYDVVLAKQGYRTVLAADGEEAVSRFAERPGEIQLVLMDMVMPRKSGSEAFAEIRTLNPDIKVIFLSGYAADRMDPGILSQGNAHLMTKPVLPRDLLRRIRGVLDGRPMSE